MSIDPRSPWFPIPLAATINANGEQIVTDALDRCAPGADIRTVGAFQIAAAIVGGCPDSCSDGTPDIRHDSVSREAVKYTDALLLALSAPAQQAVNAELIAAARGILEHFDGIEATVTFGRISGPIVTLRTALANATKGVSR